MPLDVNRIHDVPDDLLAAIDYCYEQGWTDGLPVIPPVPERVHAMLAYEGRPSEAVIATHPATTLQLTVHAAAVVDGGVTRSGDLPAEITGMLQAKSDFRANLAVLRAGERMNKSLFDILA